MGHSRLDCDFLGTEEDSYLNIRRFANGRRLKEPTDSMNRLYAAALDEPDLKRELPYCDCEVLLDRAHYLPTADRSWPDDTLVVYDYAQAADARPAPQGLQVGATKQDEAQSRLGAPERVRFDSGDEVWVYRDQGRDSRRRDPRETPELALLFDREGVLRQAAERPAYPPAAKR